MTIGDFSRATRLSAKALRFYHQAGVLSPAQVDAGNGYRMYAAGQIAEAEAIRTYRALDMPLDLIRQVLAAPSPLIRDRLLERHLARLEQQLDATRSAIAALQSLLRPSGDTIPLERRSLPPTPVAIIRETIELADLGAWYAAAMGDLDRAVEAGLEPQGHRGGLWGTELFLDERGLAALFVPIRSLEVELSGRLRTEWLPAVELVVARHEGTDDTVAEVYAALGRHVAEHEVSAEDAIRETYISSTVTEIGWPVVAA
ncbi:MAG: MerR family transcriptional regulator [Herbiconiux sp.]|uniref:MerR family transcriptional regulator n=1 Tax=Herbiconiux sp. TaxID=1871186 RepID=UPI0012254C75|nr:MerR family transcriptional regulator [Herbiconiux sp.]TAJ47277.1 MAG: MerR family transcriptional regulator [Herbiconiux sp.]